MIHAVKCENMHYINYPVKYKSREGEKNENNKLGTGLLYI
jgi:hypothetical protein